MQKKETKRDFASVWLSKEKIWTEAIEFDCWKEKKKIMKRPESGAEQNNKKITFSSLNSALWLCWWAWERAWNYKKSENSPHKHKFEDSYPEISSSPTQARNFPWKFKISSQFFTHTLKPQFFVYFFSLSLSDSDNSNSHRREKNCFQSQSKHCRDYIAFLVSEYVKSMWNARNKLKII